MKGLMMGVGLLAFAGTAFGDALEQYDSIPEMIHARGDFDESNHTFEMISEEPAAFRLSKPSFSSDSDDVVYYENWRAAIYGVYNTFAHTDLNAVSVNAVPLQYESFKNMDSYEFLEDQGITVDITREEALEALKTLSDIDDLAEVKVKTQYGYQWSPAFEGIYYEDRTPGLDEFIREFGDFCEGRCVR